MITMIDTDCDVIVNPKLFTDIFWKIRNSQKRYVIIYGGSSASKSYSMMQHVILKSFEDTGSWLIIRKFASDIYNSVYEGIEQIIKDWGLTDQFIIRQSPLRMVNRQTGARIIFKGLDDSEKIKSIFKIKYVYIEEANQISEEDFRELNRRVRGVDGIQLYLVFNPVVVTHWLKTELFDKPIYSNSADFIHATYKDARKFLTENDIIALEVLKEINPNDYKVYTLGEWGAVQTGNEFYYSFSYAKHVGETVLRLSPLHISLDFNVVPYISMSIHQIRQQDSIYYAECIDELCLSNPKNNTEALCREFERRYEDHLQYGLYFYGDSTGKNRSTRGTENDFEILERVLRKYLNNNSNRVLPSNPLHVKRRDFINKMFANQFPIRILVDSKCKHTLTDLELCQEDAEGKKHKPKERDNTGVTYERLGHMSDTLDAFYMSAFKSFQI